MRRLIVLFLLLVLPVTACTFEFQTFPQTGEQTQTPGPAPATEGSVPGNEQNLAGPNIIYKGVRFTLDPALGAHVYAFDEEITLDGATAHYTRFALTREEDCQTWCLMVYPISEFKQAFGSFVFPPLGYRGGANVIFETQKKPLSFQNGTGDRSLETFGQDHYGVSNEALHYVFRGYSADQQYGVYIQAPVRARDLPDIAPTLSADVQAILEYNRQAAESVNALTPSDFTPNLDLLDALVVSLQVEMP